MSKSYLKWLAAKVDIDMSQNVDQSYVCLMNALNNKEFYSVVGMDENRIGDALSLRRDYYGHEDTSDKLCSLLEVMVALAVRCEDDLLGGIASAGQIFWDMLDNLGLIEFTDVAFEADEVDYILDRLLDRDYDKDGVGGLFYAGDDSKIDMREEELWWQMNLYAIRKYDKIELF